MGCNHILIKDESGKLIGTGFICTSGRTKRCRWCDQSRTKLCDFPNGKKTCDAPMCDAHAKNVGNNRDYCPDHSKEIRETNKV